MKKLMLTLALAMMTTLSALAVTRAVGGFVSVTQRDGAALTVALRGDADVHYNVAEDGTLLYQDGTDYYVAVVNADGSLSSSGVLAHNVSSRTAEESALAKAQDRTAFFAAAEKEQAVRRAARREPIAASATLFPHEGTPRVLVILADFTDQKFKHEDDTTIALFDELLNSTGAFSDEAKAMDATLAKNYGSVKRYFSDMSFGVFEPQFDVKMVVHLGANMKTYGEGREDRMSVFVPAVCDSAYKKGLDFSEYDQDGNGYVDLLYIIYAGYGAHYSGVSSDAIWAKAGILGSSKQYNGKKIYRYGVNNELYFKPGDYADPRITGIGVICHEFSHCLGLPDFYPTIATAQKAFPHEMEYFSLMSVGEFTRNGYRPTAYTAWEREAMGWFEIDTLTDDMKGQQITLAPIDLGGKAYRLFKDGETEGSEYMILECVEPYHWNYGLGKSWGHGMVVTHVDYDASAFSTLNNNVNNRVSNGVGKPRMSVVSASGEYYTYYNYLANTDTASTTEIVKAYQERYIANHKTMPFPGMTNVTQVDSFEVYSGSLTKKLLEITEDTEAQTVSFWFMEKDEEPSGISEVEYTPQLADDADVCYTLGGTRVRKSDARRGIYIIGGKKYVVK